MKQHYSSAFKESIVKTICCPSGLTIMQISKEIETHRVTIRNWKRIYANISSMTF